MRRHGMETNSTVTMANKDVGHCICHVRYRESLSAVPVTCLICKEGALCSMSNPIKIIGGLILISTYSPFWAGTTIPKSVFHNFARRVLIW